MSKSVRDLRAFVTSTRELSPEKPLMIREPSARGGVALLGVVGPSGAGKTTLLRQLMPELLRRGLRVGYLKHAHHEIAVDTPGKDSHAIAEAGAEQVLVASPQRVVLFDNRAAAAASLDALLPRFDAAGLDLILVEGFHRSPHPKLEVFRTAVGKPPLFPEDADIIAVVADGPLSGERHPPRLPIDDPAAVADFVMARLSGLAGAGADPHAALARWARAPGRRQGGEQHVAAASVRQDRRLWLACLRDGPIRSVEDVMSADLDAEPRGGHADLALHVTLYRALADARAVIEVQSPYALAVGFAGRDFVPLDVEGMRRLGSVPVLSNDPEIPPDKLAEKVAKGLSGACACLVAGRGIFARAPAVDAALELAAVLELSAKVYVLARQAAAL